MIENPGWWSGLHTNQSSAQSETHESRDIENVQARHQFRAMVFDGFVADFQNQSDGFGGLAFGQQLEDLELARGNCSSGLAERAICCRGKFLMNWRRISRLR